MQRRNFLQSSAAAAATTLFADMKPKRVGLIGSGWYGKCDLLRLIQVAPVEVVSICDVDKIMLSKAAELGMLRQAKIMTITTGSQTAQTGTLCLRSTCVKSVCHPKTQGFIEFAHKKTTEAEHRHGPMPRSAEIPTQYWPDLRRAR